MVEKRKTGYLLQDIGLTLLILCIAFTAVMTGNVGEELKIEFTVMMIGTFLALLLAGFKFMIPAAVVAAFEVLAYTVYKLYFYYSYSLDIEPMCYMWLIVPVTSVGAMFLFIYSNRRTEIENDILKEQVGELVMIDPLTGLYNLKSLFNDLQKQIAYTERNELDLSLMIIKLRYEQELRKVLSRRNFEKLLQRMAEVVIDAVRVEDRVYSLDENGTIGVILTCDQASSISVIQRIRSFMHKKEAFQDIADNAVRVEVKIACLQYDKEAYGTDVIRFKQKVENELQYDV